MKLLINGEEIERKVPEKTTLAGILQLVEDNHVAKNEVIAAVLVDGEPLTAERLSIWKDRPTDDFDETSVETKTRNSFAAEALHLISQRLSESTQQRDQIVTHLSQGRSNEAMQILSNYLQTWSALQQNLAGATRLMEIKLESLEVFERSEPDTPRALPVAQCVGHLTEQLEQLKSALEAGDLVLLADILDYEFSGLADSWCDILNQLADQFDPQE